MLDEYERRSIFSFFKLCRDEKTVKSSNYDIDIGTVCLCKLLMSAENLLGLIDHSHVDYNASYVTLSVVTIILSVARGVLCWFVCHLISVAVLD
jgi:hypothetical protein